MKVTYRITVEQDDMPVRGNALASGDDAEDKACEDEILRRLENGDLWAWGYVTVTAECAGFTGCDSLGGCNYKDEAQFKEPGGYFEDMKERALDDLRDALKQAVRDGRNASAVLARLNRARLKRCAGRMQNGPAKKYTRCGSCGAIDWELNEGDRCRAMVPGKAR